jgi:hypothetical protein
MRFHSKSRLWFARILIGLVFFFNVQSGFAFILDPGKYASSYQLVGIPGFTAIQGFGILFLMWNVPYFVALLHPKKYWIPLLEAIVMQFIGLIGESWILVNLPPQNLILGKSIHRFITFDAAGFVLLMLSMWLTKKTKII